MRRLTKGFVFLVIAIVLTLVLAVPTLFGACAPTAPKGELPEIISFTSYEVGSSGYVVVASVCSAIAEKTGQPIRVLPAGSDTMRMAPVRAGKINLLQTGGGAYFAAQGLFDFASIAWGPQPLRIVWNEYGRFPCATAKDAGIRTPADLKGKRVYWIPGSTSLNLANTAYMAFGGLTWDDVERVEFPSMSAAHKGMIAGKCDAGLAGFTTPGMFELEASPRGLYWPEFPHADKAAWERMVRVDPYFSPAVQPGAGAGVTKPLEVMANPTSFFVFDFTDEHIAYWFTKQTHECYDMYKDVIDRTKELRIDIGITPSVVVPFHPGSVRYFKEIGYWTDELEARNNELLAEQEKLKEAWESALTVSAEQKIKSKDFPRFWMERRSKIPGIWVPPAEIVEAYFK